MAFSGVKYDLNLRGVPLDPESEPTGTIKIQLKHRFQEKHRTLQGLETLVNDFYVGPDFKSLLHVPFGELPQDPQQYLLNSLSTLNLGSLYLCNFLAWKIASFIVDLAERDHEVGFTGFYIVADVEVVIVEVVEVEAQDCKFYGGDARKGELGSCMVCEVDA